jgi:hypothetical protein
MAVTASATLAGSPDRLTNNTPAVPVAAGQLVSLCRAAVMCRSALAGTLRFLAQLHSNLTQGSWVPFFLTC